MGHCIISTSTLSTLILYVHAAFFGMPTSSTTSIVPPASVTVPPAAESSKSVPLVAESSVRQQQVMPKTRRRAPRMIYGFTFSHDELVEWGIRHYGKDDKVMQHYLRAGRAMGPLFTRCYRLWPRTTKQIVRYYSGPRRGDVNWCLSLADTISHDTAMPPPREIINEIKEALETTQDPEWHRFDGD